MKRSINMWQLVGFGVTSLSGTLLHFLYDWSGKSSLVAPFSSVNESTWEHMKLLFWPLFIYAIAEYFFFKERRDFWFVKLRGTLLGLVLIPVLFYTYNGAIGKSPDWINIAIFFISAAAVFRYESKLFRRNGSAYPSQWLAIASLSVIALFFIVFTFATPQIGIFMDPTTGTYGVIG